MMADSFCSFKQYVLSYYDENGKKLLTTIDGNYTKYSVVLSNLISDSGIMTDSDITTNVIDIPFSGFNEEALKFISK